MIKDETEFAKLLLLPVEASLEMQLLREEVDWYELYGYPQFVVVRKGIYINLPQFIDFTGSSKSKGKVN